MWPDDGVFSLAGLRIGTYEVTVRLEDYLDAALGSVEVNADQPTDLGSITLQVNSGGISGQVVDELGEPWRCCG